MDASRALTRFSTGSRWACLRDRALNFPAMILMGWMTPIASPAEIPSC